MEDDLLRNPPGRYLGYADAVGSTLPGISPVARVVMTRATFCYITFDVITKSIDKRKPNFVSKGVDAFLWQGLTSLLIPSFVVQGAAQVASLVNLNLKVKSPTNRYVSMGLILLSLPVLGSAIDRVVDWVFDNTTRPILFSE